MKGSRKFLGFVRLEELGGCRCRYVGGWRAGDMLVIGEAFNGMESPEVYLRHLRQVSRRLRAIPKPEAGE